MTLAPTRWTALVALIVAAVPLGAAAADDPAETACHAKDTTVAIVDCLGGLTAQWDRRLNTAYQAALKAAETPVQRTALTRAERAWVNYRDANCGYYDAHEGTIREVLAAGCELTMTRARTLELEDALRP